MKKLIFILSLGFTGLFSATSPIKNDLKIVNAISLDNNKVEANTKENTIYKYYYGMGAVDTGSSGTCFTYGQYTCLDDDSYCTFTPHNTRGTVPTTCLGDGNYQA